MRQCITLFRGLYAAGSRSMKSSACARSRSSPAATAASSPVASSSACCWPSRSSTILRCCSWMSRPQVLTPRRGAISGSSCSRSRRAARPSSSPRTTWRRRSCCAMRSRSWTAADIIAQGGPRQLLHEHFAEVLLELPRAGFPRGRARARASTSSRRPDRVEISTHDLEGTLRALLDAQVPLNEPAHPAAQPRGPVPRAHRQGAARMIRRLLAVWHARNLEFLRDRGTLDFHAAAAVHGRHRHGLRVRRPGAPAVQGRGHRHPRSTRRPIRSSASAIVQFVTQHGSRPRPCASSPTSRSTCWSTRTPPAATG